MNEWHLVKRFGLAGGWAFGGMAPCGPLYFRQRPTRRRDLRSWLLALLALSQCHSGMNNRIIKCSKLPGETGGRIATPGYLQPLGIPLLQERDLEATRDAPG